MTDLSIVRRIHTVVKFTDDEFHGRYRKHDIDIEREPDDRFYIMVRAPDGGLVYDGWWSGGWLMKEAVVEALRGACLLKETNHVQS